MTSLALPPLAELLATAHVVALPLTTRFRGIEVREAMVFAGPEGSTEFSPFVEYDDAEASTWLAAAIDFGWSAQSAPLRERVRVNATIPAVNAAGVAEMLALYGGCRTAKVKVAEPKQAFQVDSSKKAVLKPKSEKTAPAAKADDAETADETTEA
jgi:O-succinylbenzoate synthase